VVSGLKRLELIFALLAICAFSTLAIMLPSAVKASPATSSISVTVDHVVDIRESGLLVINDTLTLSRPDDTVALPENYVLGFPFTYQTSLVYAFAHEASKPNSKLNLGLNVGMGRIGFYGVDVDLRAGIDKFTVVFVFSDRVSFSTTTLGQTEMVFYNASFPAYPSLPQLASEVRLKMTTPASLNYSSSSFEREGIDLSQTSEGSRRVFSYVKSNLTEFSDQPAWFYASKIDGTTQILDVDAVERKIEILGSEQIAVSDSYRMINKVGKLEEIRLKLPTQSHSVSIFDEFGQVPDANVKIEQADTYTNITITPTLPSEKGDEVYLLVQYRLKWKNYVTLRNVDHFYVSLSLFENTDWTIRRLTATVILPEGAALLSLEDSESVTNVQKAALLSSFVVAFQNATPFHNFSFDFTYQREIFWDSFRPTVWIGMLTLAVGTLGVSWRAYRPLPTAPLPTAVISVRAEDLKNFVSHYDEKRRLLREVESLETAARKGKIPRRQYKVRKMTVDSRLTSLSRDLAALRDTLRTAGPRYSELMRQLEVAETELEGVEADIGRTEIRYRRGEISAAAYHKLLEDSYRRRDRAQTTIDGVLLRLREEVT